MSKEVIKSSQFAHAQILPVQMQLTLNPEQQAALAELYEGLDKVRPGQLLTGSVLKADSDGVLVDINYKSYGLIPGYEFSAHEIKKLQPGTAIEVILDELEGPDGMVVLSYEKAKEARAWGVITKLFEEQKPVEGVVTHKVKGGLSVDIGIPAFLPGSQVDTNRVTNFDQYVGQTITAEIIKINRRRGNVIISRRKYLGNLRTESKKKVMETLQEGSIVQGVVKNITNYGVFVDIGGVDGLLHITDMTWGRIAHPSEMIKLGQNLTVKVLSVDKENAKVSLGIKQLSDNPWESMSEEIKAGARLKGTVSSITDYGMFVELQKGVEGLVHISEVSWNERVTDLKKYFKVNDQAEVYIVSVDKDNRRISLSIKQLEKNPWESLSKEYSPGQKIKGTVNNITDFGLFVTLKPGVDGLIHVSDLSWTEHINHPADLYKKGQEVEAIVLHVDEANKKISLGIKQLTQDPWEIIEQEYPRGSTIEGTVAKITNFGAFVKLPHGLEGLVHVSELADTPVEKVEDVLSVGQKTNFKVLVVNKEDRKVALSLKTDLSEMKQKKQRVEPREARRQPEKTKSQLQLELEKHLSETKDN